jgi:TusA-related sulfurtransferase
MEHYLDTCGEMCPLPVLRAKARLRSLRSGDTLKVLTDHSCAVEALLEHAAGIGLTVEVSEFETGVWELCITV